MPTPLPLDLSKCQQRNRLAARLDGLDGALLNFLPEPEEALARGDGRLPKSESEALTWINRHRTGGESLTAEDVWIHYLEAASTRFVPDRYLFLAESTLRNIAAEAAAGVAFMNSHRSGGLSHPGELPFGRTFAGRYDSDGERAVLGIFMLRGAEPNGNGGPSTDDLHAGIDAGTIFDVSVGLYGGERICDVCGLDISGYSEAGEGACPHVPGTSYSMNEDDVKRQKKRGVPDGKCSYSLLGAHLGEVSAVYDGAVPGAGFLPPERFAPLYRGNLLGTAYAKALRLGKSLPDECRRECLALFGETFGKTTFEPARAAGDGAGETLLASVTTAVSRAEAAFALRQTEGRTLGRETRAGLESLHGLLGRLLEEATPAPPALDPALRERALRVRAQTAQLLAGS